LNYARNSRRNHNGGKRAGESSKFQNPSSREASKFNFQIKSFSRISRGLRLKWIYTMHSAIPPPSALAFRIIFLHPPDFFPRRGETKFEDFNIRRFSAMF